MAEDETTGEKLERLRTRLSIEQRTFCEEFIRTQDSKASYLKAYGTDNARSGYTLLARWYVRDYITALLEGSDLQELLVTRDEVINTLAEVMRDGDARDQDRIRAAEVAGKFIGIATVKRHEVTGKNGGPVLTGLDVEQIRQLRADFLGVDPDKMDGGESE